MDHKKAYPFPIAVTEAAASLGTDFSPRRIVPAAIGVRAAAFVVTTDEFLEWENRTGGAPLIIAGRHPRDLAAYTLRTARAYELSLLPPFTQALARHVGEDPSYFATPGHHSGAFFRQTAGGRVFYDFLGASFFQADLSDSDAAVGDVTAHEGLAGEAEALAARVWQADRTYFVLGGTSASNRICCSALLTPGDLVLFDRNNHKSLYQGALVQCGAVPVYLEAVRNGAGTIGGISARSLSEEHLRRQIRKIAPEKAGKKRPFRLACVQLCTYDGIFCCAEDLIRRIGPLCDYILFDSAWGGYEPFLPVLQKASPLRAARTEADPGILVTQSVHKQLAGFSQTSQIQRKDSHLPMKRRIPDEAFQQAFLSQISTSPCIPLFAGLEMNAQIHAEKGEFLWKEAARFAVELRKAIAARCRYIRPFQPDAVDGRPWTDYDTETILSERRFWAIRPGDGWHGFRGLQKGQSLLDPCKILLYTRRQPDGTEEEPAIPAAILSAYLQERQIIPEKADLHSLLLLAEPGDGAEKMDRLLSALTRFEAEYDQDAPLSQCMPALCAAYPERYGRMTLQALCREQAGFLQSRQADRLLQKLFRKKHLPRQVLSGKAAGEAFIRGEGELVPLSRICGRTALEPAIAYPPGICNVAAGEAWNRTARDYFQCLAAYGRAFPGFAAELQGIAQQENGSGQEACGWVKKEK